MLPVAGRALLDHHLDALEAAGIREVVVVAGYASDQIVKHVADRARVVINERWETTNSIVSLHQAAPHLAGEAFLFQNADVLYAPSLVARFVHAGAANACLVDPLRPFADGEYRVEVQDGRIVRYSRDVPRERSVGESAQLVKIGVADSTRFLDRLGEVINAGGHRGFPNQAYDILMAGEGLWPVFTAGLAWWEVDTPDDYERCTDAFKPVPADESDDPAPPSAGSRIVSFLRQPRVPWRYRWVPVIARTAIRHPVRTAGYVRDYRAGQLSLEGLDLLVNGPSVLALVQREAHRAGLRPMLLWGTLLGAVRDEGFIRNDRDLDLGIMEAESARLPAFREAMLEHGYRVRIENGDKLSVVHPGHPRLFVDVDVVHPFRDGWAITNSNAVPGRLFRYLFRNSVFEGTTAARLGDELDVLLPAEPEGFLTAVYGDWRIPQPKAHFLYGPLNVEVEIP